MSQFIDFTLPSTVPGRTLHGFRCVPEGQVRAVLQLSHGMVEYIDRYRPLAEYLADRGILVTGHDHLGHGASIRTKEDYGYFAEPDGNRAVLADLHAVTVLTKQLYPDLPYFLLGHSMGSFYARQYLCEYGRELDGAIIMGTGFQPKALVKTAKTLCRVLATFHGWHYRSRGFFPVEELKTLRKIGSRLQGHPNMNSVPGVDMSTGSLGQGISAACGMALGAKHAGSAVNVYAILGDGEVEEGECWEAFMFAAHYGLSNLCVMLDRNHLQIDGTTETVMNSAPLEDKLRAFNFNVVTINGHDFDQIESAVQAFHAETEKPTCIILDTVKGTGVSYMTNSVAWHGKGPNDEEYQVAMNELNAAYAALEQEEN